MFNYDFVSYQDICTALRSSGEKIFLLRIHPEETRLGTSCDHNSFCVFCGGFLSPLFLSFGARRVARISSELLSVEHFHAGSLVFLYTLFSFNVRFLSNSREEMSLLTVQQSYSV